MYILPSDPNKIGIAIQFSNQYECLSVAERVCGGSFKRSAVQLFAREVVHSDFELGKKALSRQYTVPDAFRYLRNGRNVSKHPDELAIRAYCFSLTLGLTLIASNFCVCVPQRSPVFRREWHDEVLKKLSLEITYDTMCLHTNGVIGGTMKTISGSILERKMQSCDLCN